MKTILFNAMLAITMMMCSCEKFTPEEESSKPIPRENNVTLDLSSKDQVKKACKKVSFGFFKDDAKAGIISQTSDDSDFGAIHLSLAAGTYEVVAIGHNGSGTTISSPEKITFTSNKVTDTFYYYGILDVTDGEKTTESITLKRAVGMFRLAIKDEIQSRLRKLNFITQEAAVL